MQLHDITLWKLSSILVIFLLINIPFAFATEIKLSFGPESKTFPFTGRGFVNKEIEVKEGRVFLNISSREGYTLRRVLLFPCRGLSPLECIGEEPIEYEGYSRTYLNLEDLLENGRGGILTLVMLNTTSWVGFWDSWEAGAFVGRDINSLGLETSQAPEGVEELVTDYGMIPLNWIEETDFGGRELYQIEAERVLTQEGETLNFTRTLRSGELLDTSRYLFAFPGNGRVYNPLTFYYQPPVECGNYLCELGESQATCCRDCGCPENQTCSRTGCVPAGDIKLVLDSMKPTPPLECYIHNSSCVFQDLLELGLHIENPPLEYWINDYFFQFGNQSHREMACLPGKGDDLSCSVLLPDMNRSRAFQERRVLSLYVSIGYLEMAEVRTEELSLDLGLDIKGTDLEEELDLQSYRDKLKQMAKRMEAINKILQFIKTLFLIYNAIEIINTVRGIIHEGLAATHAKIAVGCSNCCSPTPWGASCCACLAINSKLSALHGVLGNQAFIVAALFAVKAAVSYGIMMLIEKLLEAWAKHEMGKLEDRLKQRIERMEQDTMKIVGDEVSGILPLLVWAKGSFSGEYTQTVCNGEGVEIWYDFTPLNCSGGLWLTPEGMARQRVNETGRHLLLAMRADELFPGRNAMDMGIECNSTRYYSTIMDTMPFLNYTEVCGGVPEPRITINRPPNGTVQAERNITLAYSVSHPLRMNACNTLVNGEIVQGRPAPETGREYEFTLYDLVPGSYKWRVECDDILGVNASSGEYEFRIGGS